VSEGEHPSRITDPIRLVRMVNQVEGLKGEMRKHKDPIRLVRMVNQVEKLKAMRENIKTPSSLSGW
jgi:hypothetical protein